VPDEARADIIGLYRRAWQHTDATIAELPPDAPAPVPWWGEGAEVTLGHVLVHMTTETQRHAGHADTVRELIDGSVGLLSGGTKVSSDDPGWWRDYRDRVEQTARTAG
jgi:hypothetical protein